MKSLEELKNEMASLYANKQGVAIAKKVKVFTVDLHLGTPQQYDYEYSKNIIAEYAFIAGFDAAIKAVSEREKEFIKRTEAAISFLDGINDKTIAEIEVYNSLSEALKECRGMK